MAKRIILAALTLVVVLGAYYVLAEHEPAATVQSDPQVREDIHRFIQQPTSQSANTITQGNIPFSPGDNTRFRVYDEVTNRLKYVFEAEKWEPVTESKFRVVKLNIEIYTPKGQITFIRADESEVDVQKNASGGMDPKRGFVKGNVQVVMDRTTLDWREAHPDMAAADAHPDQLIRIWLDEARFDMDLAELSSDSTILIDSADARIERVAGLTLQWNQVDNRVDSLKFKQGGLMKLRRGGRMIDFGLPGSERSKRAPGAGAAAAVNVALEPAQANAPMTLDAVSADDAAEEIRIEAAVVDAKAPPDGEAAPTPDRPTRTPDEFAADASMMQSEVRLAAAGVTTQPSDIVSGQRGKKKIDTYRAVFTGNVVIEQNDGMKTIGKLEADRLEVNFDFGQKQKGLASTERPRDAGQPGSLNAAGPPAEDELTDDNTRLTLSWNGPLELRPIQVDAELQTGERFDAIANGAPVRVTSERGNAVCSQLVYRHERRQVWLSGTDEAPADLGVSAARRLKGREVFFDQKRGLARVDGPGAMTDSRTGAADEGDELFPGGGSSGTPTANSSRPSKPRDPVDIRWARGVDIDIGSREVERIDPSTGRAERKRREFLRRAWFHGDVSVTQGKHKVNGDELAVTFGEGADDGDVAARIDHIDVVKDVRLSSEKDYISADRLEVQMTLTPEGKSVARVANAVGNVKALQGTLEFSASKMHVLLNQSARGDSRLAIERLDAVGDVLVQDPNSNLKISRCETLSATMQDDNKLATAIIVSSDPSVLARVRYDDFAVHGHRVEIDAVKESIYVPGPGKSWMVTRQDLSGRKLQRPTTVKTTWEGRMVMELGQDYGVFAGGVHSLTDTFALDCDKLTVRFMPAPPDERTSEGKHRYWGLGDIMNDRGSITSDDRVLPATKRKRPASVVADGHAVAITSNYAPTQTPDTPGRLLSRLRIDGEQIAADLRREEMWVPSKGTLLIEDYQFDTSSPARLASSSGGPAPLMSTMSRDGPSQTAITWANSMKFFVDQSTVAFDHTVQMVHRSGQQMVMQKELAEAMQLDEKMVRLSRGRRASLACEHLIIEFLSGQTAGGRSAPKDVSIGGENAVRATDLQRLISKGGVHLQDSGKSLIGDELTYVNDTQEVTLIGTPAQIFDQDEAGQTFNTMTGPKLIWNRKTNRVDAPGASFRNQRQ